MVGNTKFTSESEARVCILRHRPYNAANMNGSMRELFHHNRFQPRIDRSSGFMDYLLTINDKVLEGPVRYLNRVQAIL